MRGKKSILCEFLMCLRHWIFAYYVCLVLFPFGWTNFPDRISNQWRHQWIIGCPKLIRWVFFHKFQFIIQAKDSSLSFKNPYFARLQKETGVHCSQYHVTLKYFYQWSHSNYVSSYCSSKATTWDYSPSDHSAKWLGTTWNKTYLIDSIFVWKCWKFGKPLHTHEIKSLSFGTSSIVYHINRKKKKINRKLIGSRKCQIWQRPLEFECLQWENDLIRLNLAYHLNLEMIRWSRIH